MPEGNELHRYAERQAEFFEGHILTVDAPNGRFEDGAKRLNRRRLQSVEAFGKHLLYNFGKGRNLHVHLGLYGKFRDGAMPFPEPKGALRLRFSTRDHWLELRGPTACEVFDDAGRDKLISRIGPDPLREDAKPKVAFDYILKSNSPIGALLMDQSVIGGIGNIYRAELLFRENINPFLPGKTVTAKQLRAMWQDAKVLMKAGMLERRIITTRPADRPHPTGKVRPGEGRYVYRRKALPCFICGTEILMKEFVGRKLYWCPNCQA